MLLSKLFAPIGLFRTRFWIPLPLLCNEYQEFNEAPPQIDFSEPEEARGRGVLRRLGIDTEEWYACIFARDSAYYKKYSPHTDISFSEHRNADIESYHLAISAILDAGGWVIRMGSCVAKPLSFEHPRVIDYASLYRDDFADVYLTAHARFYLGGNSGASDLAMLFDVPFVNVNCVPIGYAPFGKNSIFIPKRIVYTANGKQVPMRQQLDAFTGNQVGAAIIPDELLSKRGWQFVDNTPEEIADAVKEMLDRLDNRFCDDDPTYLNALDRYQAILPIQNIYRANRSPMSRSMLLSIDLGAA
jgi:putative glycosyltransferase (TIGR04372 family)